MKIGIAKAVLFGFAILVVASILLMWKSQDRENALRDLKEVYQVEIDHFNGEIHMRAAGKKVTDLGRLADLILRAEKLEDGTPLAPDVLDLTGNTLIRNFQGIEKLKSLRSLIAVDCPSLASLDGISGLPNLSELIVSHNKALTSVAAIRDLPELLTIDLASTEGITKAEFKNLPKLKNLYLSSCRNLEALDMVEYGEIEQLYLDGCMKIRDIQGLGQLTQMTDLDVSNCQELTHLDGLESLNELIVLDMRNVEIPDFSIIQNLPKLEVLRLAGQGSITDLKSFTSLVKLRELHIESCLNLKSLEGLPPAVHDYLGVIRCHKLTSLDGIEVASKLMSVELNGCGSLENIEALSSLPLLTRLSFLNCSKVKAIQSLERNPALAIVRFGGTQVVPLDVVALQEVLKDCVFDFSEQE